MAIGELLNEFLSLIGAAKPAVKEAAQAGDLTRRGFLQGTAAVGASKAIPPVASVESKVAGRLSDPAPPAWTQAQNQLAASGGYPNVSLEGIEDALRRAPQTSAVSLSPVQQAIQEVEKFAGGKVEEVIKPTEETSTAKKAGLAAGATGGAVALSDPAQAQSPIQQAIDETNSRTSPVQQAIAEVSRETSDSTMGTIVGNIEKMREAGQAKLPEQKGPPAGTFLNPFRKRAGQGPLSEFLSVVEGATQMGLSSVSGTLASVLSRTDKPPSETGKAPGFAGATPHYQFHAPREASPSDVEQIGQLTSLLAPGVGIMSYGKMVNAPVVKKTMDWFEKTFSPTTVDVESRIAEGLHREFYGTAARNSAETAEAMRPYHAAINALPDADRLNFIDAIEGGPARIAGLNPVLRDLGRKMRDGFQQRAASIAALPAHAQTQFVNDYFPHFWKDPNAAQQFMQSFTGGVAKQGSGASLKKRSIPTISDGIKAGLEPLTTDPIEATMRYVASMDRFIASESVRDVGLGTGMIKYFKPKVYGASGHPQSFKGPPQGWVALEGRGATNAAGAQAYAPEGFARVYNNFISKGLFGNAEAGTAYDVIQRSNNWVTALELGLSGYHAGAMVVEAYTGRIARGLHDIVGGVMDADLKRVMRGGVGVATAPVAPVTSAIRGYQLEKVYLGLTPGSTDMARITNLLEKAGGRAHGTAHAKDYLTTAMGTGPGNYVRAFRQGALRGQLLADAADIRASPVIGSLRVGFRHLGRAMQTVMAPLFEVYIPKLKNGAFYDMMHSWLEANPQASHDAQLAAARQIWDSVDNRFGELVSDNVFWNNTLKHASTLAMRSYSWNLGSVRELVGGAKDIATAEWSPRAAYVIALPVAVGTLNAVYQYLKIGEGPKDVMDLVAGRTGGTAPGAAVPPAKGFGRSTRAEVPERIMIPGYQKDVLGWYENWYQEALNKMSTLPRAIGQIAANQDWRGDPIINPEHTAPQWLKEYFDYALKSFGPISIRQLEKGEKEGSAITVPEQLGGLRPAPSAIQDPEGYRQQQVNLHNRAWLAKQRREKREQELYGGTDQ